MLGHSINLGPHDPCTLSKLERRVHGQAHAIELPGMGIPADLRGRPERDTFALLAKA